MMKIYNSLPVTLQNLSITIYGLWLRWQRYGGEYNNIIEHLKENEILPYSSLLEEQKKLLLRILKCAYKTSTFYRELFDRVDLDIKKLNNHDVFKEIKKIPMLDKEIIRKNVDDILSQPKRFLVKWTTGGTLGNPLTVYTNISEIRYFSAFPEARILNWYGLSNRDKKVKFLGRKIVPISEKSPPFWRYNLFNNEIFFSIFHLNDNTYKYYIKALEDISPLILIGYPSIISLLSQYLLENNLSIPSIKLVWLTSEVLLPWQKDVIKLAFPQAYISNNYSSTEGVAFISQCPFGNYHVSLEYGYIDFEPVNNNLYEIIGTSLFRRIMPMIRYRTGDLVKLSNPYKNCPCGRNLPIVDEIIGRTSESIKLPNGGILTPSSLSDVFRNILGIKNAQIIQEDRSSIVVNLVLEEDYMFEYVKREILKEFRSIIDTELIKIYVEKVKELRLSKDGKYRLVISNIE